MIGATVLVLVLVLLLLLLQLLLLLPLLLLLLLLHPLRLWGACPPNMQSRPFWGVWIAISQGVGQDARRVIQTFA